MVLESECCALLTGHGRNLDTCPDSKGENLLEFTGGVVRETTRYRWASEGFQTQGSYPVRLRLSWEVWHGAIYRGDWGPECLGIWTKSFDRIRDYRLLCSEPEMLMICNLDHLPTSGSYRETG